MAAETLEKFVELYDDVASAEQRLKAFRQNPYNKDAYSDVLKQAIQMGGRDPRSINPQTGAVEELSPRTIQELLLAWYNTAKTTSINYADSNLEQILKELDKEKFSNILLFTLPSDKECYSEVARLHGEYAEMHNTLEVYKRSEEQEQKLAAIGAMQKKSSVLIKERIEKLNEKRRENGEDTILDEKGIEMWTNAFTYIAMINPGFALQVYGEGIQEKYDAIKEKLGDESKIGDYIAQSVKDLSFQITEDREKAGRETDEDKKKELENKADKYDNARQRFCEGLYRAARN